MDGILTDSFINGACKASSTRVRQANNTLLGRRMNPNLKCDRVNLGSGPASGSGILKLNGFHGGIMPPPASIHCGFGLDGVTETP
jgi:hypothetical protein